VKLNSGVTDGLFAYPAIFFTDGFHSTSERAIVSRHIWQTDRLRLQPPGAISEQFSTRVGRWPQHTVSRVVGRVESRREPPHLRRAGRAPDRRETRPRDPDRPTERGPYTLQFLKLES